MIHRYAVCATLLVVSLSCHFLRAAEFETRDVQGFRVYVSKAALEDKPDETERGLKHMDNQLFQVMLVVDEARLAELQRVPIWMANGEPKLGIAFHPGRGWLTDRGYRPPKTPSMIGVVRGKHYLHESLRQPWLIFHELCHGYDWFTLGNQRQYGNDVNTDGYQRAMATGKYQSSLHWDAKDRKPYHATNRMEFFAETSEAFFGTNDIFPFVRAELRDHDPATYEMLAKLWHVDLAERKRDEQALLAALRVCPRITGRKEDSIQRLEGDVVFKPHDQYSEKKIEGWTVLVNPALMADKPLADRTLRLLERDLHYVRRYVPTDAAKKLQQTVIWLEHDNPVVPHVAYHATGRWLDARLQSSAKAAAIEIGSAKNYLRWFELQPSVMLRQLAYAYCRDTVGQDNDELVAAFERAKENELYAKVLRFDGERVPHPGLSNPVEFFVESTETYFGTNDHYPFVRAELRARDPETAELMEKLW